MRLSPLDPETLSPGLREVHDGITALIARTQDRIVVLDAEGSLIGPFPAMLRFPQFGVPALVFQRTLSSEARLPKTVREVAILTVGATFGARYELYAHEITAAEVGLSPSQIATLAAGGCPSGLSNEEAIAHDVGYQNPFVFSNAFTKWIGWRPSLYRRKKLTVAGAETHSRTLLGANGSIAGPQQTRGSKA